MIFGATDAFAIEIGAIESYPGYSGLYAQFRFWVSNLPIGDWNDRISIIASIENARTICATEEDRRCESFAQCLSAEVFQATYDEFFSCDFTRDPMDSRNLRDRFHLDAIGMGAIEDKYGLVLVASSESMERVIVKDLRQSQIVADLTLPWGFVESALGAYINWGVEQLR